MLSVLLLPLLLAALTLHPPSRRVGLALAPWAALPALLLALAAPAGLPLELPWLLLGSRFGLDETGRLFLFFSAALWLAAGHYARAYLAGDPRRHVFTAFFLVALAGNLGVCLALDAATFYLAFAVMTFAAYGLVVHTGGAEALRAGRVYLVMAVLGEGLLLAGLLLLAGAAGTHLLPEMTHLAALDPPMSAYVLLFLGFGVKAGVPLLHMWLPLAHPVAPTPASAVLSGVMIKAGLLGWLRFLPLGEMTLPGLGATMLGLGLGAAFFGVVVGLAQRDAKTVLAYSSISQMGFMTLAVGAGLLAPLAWLPLLSVVGFYALHHALAKGALFLGLGVAQRRGFTLGVRLGLALPALALAGAPFTSGALAKAGLSAALAALPAPWPMWLAGAMGLAAAGTALLMLHFLDLARRQRGRGDSTGLLAPWFALLALLAVVTLAWVDAAVVNMTALSWPGLWSSIWPLLLAAAIFSGWRGWRHLNIPAGDVLPWLERLVARLHRITMVSRLPMIAVRDIAPLLRARSHLLETRLRAWTLAGGLWLLLFAVFFTALWLG